MQATQSELVRGVVVDERGAALSGVRVVALENRRSRFGFPEPPGQVRPVDIPYLTAVSALTDADGKFEMEVADANMSCVVGAVDADGGLASGFVWREWGSEPLRLVIEEHSIVRAIVLDGDGEPLSSTTAKLQWMSDSGEVVDAHSLWRAADDSARFSIGADERLLRGRWRARILASGHFSRVFEFEASGDDVDLGEIRLEPIEPITIQVLGPDGAPLKRARLVVVRSTVFDGGDYGNTLPVARGGETVVRANDRGIVSLSRREMGETSFLVIRDESERHAGSALRVLPTSADEPLVVRTVRGGSVFGRVSGRENAWESRVVAVPVDEGLDLVRTINMGLVGKKKLIGLPQEVEALLEPRAEHEQIVVGSLDENDEFEMSHLRPGRWLVAVLGPEAIESVSEVRESPSTAVALVYVVEERPCRVDLVLPPRFPVRGIVRLNGVALPGARVFLSTGDSRFDKPLTTTTGKSGDFDFDVLETGSYVLEVASDRADCPSAQVVEVGPASGSLEIDLGGEYSGTVVDERGRPLRGVGVTVIPNHDELSGWSLAFDRHSRWGIPPPGVVGNEWTWGPVEDPEASDWKYFESVLTDESGTFRVMGVRPDRDVTVELRKYGEPPFMFPVPAGTDAGTLVIGERGSLLVRPGDQIRRAPQLIVRVEFVRDGARLTSSAKRVTWGRWPMFYDFAVPGEYEITASVPSRWDGPRPVSFVPVCTVKTAVTAGERTVVVLE